MTDSGLSLESIGEYKVHIGAAVISVVLGVINPHILCGVMIVGAVFCVGKKAFDAYERSQLKKWYQTQLESDSVPTELKEKYAEMLAKLILNIRSYCIIHFIPIRS